MLVKLRRLIVIVGLLLVVLVFYPTNNHIVFADTSITFEWDANSEADLAGYRLYKSTRSDVYIYETYNIEAEVLAGVETATITVADGEWFFVLTAFNNYGKESAPSNEVTLITDSVK
jgi:hypothetical protein